MLKCIFTMNSTPGFYHGTVKSYSQINARLSDLINPLIFFLIGASIGRSCSFGIADRIRKLQLGLIA